MKKLILLAAALMSLSACASKPKNISLTIGDSYVEKIKTVGTVKLKDTATEKESYDMSATSRDDYTDNDGQKYTMYKLQTLYSYERLNNTGGRDESYSASIQLFFLNAEAKVNEELKDFHVNPIYYINDCVVAPDYIKVYSGTINLPYGESIGGKFQGQFKIKGISQALPEDIECVEDYEITNSAKEYAMNVLKKGFECMNAGIKKAQLYNIFTHKASSSEHTEA